MTWVTPRTWATGLVVTATILNTEIRDQLLHYAIHNHDGGSGNGASAIDPTTFRMNDSADPAAPGSGKTIIWTNSGKLHQRAGAAGAAEEFSVVGHTHTVSEDVAGAETGTYSTSDTPTTHPDITVATEDGWFYTNTNAKLMSERSVTFNDPGLAFASARVLAEHTVSGGGLTGSITMALIADGTTLESFTDASPTDAEEYELFLSGEKAVSAGASSFKVELTNTDTDGSDYLTFNVRMYSGSATDA